MDHNDREQFWKTLCSLPGNDIVAEREQLFKSIKYPKLLFRYRPVSTKSLEALRTNRLYFSSANYYDDPFDTFLHIDIEAIRKEYLSAFQTPESTEAVVDGVKSLLGNILSEEQAAQFTVENVTNALSHGLTESFLNAALSLRDEVKKDTMTLYVTGGGGCLVKNFYKFSADRVKFVEDICAAAKGYEYLAEAQMKAEAKG